MDNEKIKPASGQPNQAEPQTGKPIKQTSGQPAQSEPQTASQPVQQPTQQAAPPAPTSAQAPTQEAPTPAQTTAPAPQQPTQAPIQQPVQQPTQAQEQQTPEQAKQAQRQILETTPTKITITLPTNAYFVSGIRDFTLSLIRNMTEFSEQWAFRFQSVVDELCNNAIEHGSAPGQDIKITFISVPHESIEISVEDTGTGKVKLTAKELQAILSERTDPNYVHVGIRGRGLSKIVYEWTDEVEFQDIEPSGIKVRVKKYLKDPRLKEMTDMLESPTHLVLT